MHACVRACGIGGGGDDDDEGGGGDSGVAVVVGFEVSYAC